MIKSLTLSSKQKGYEIVCSTKEFAGLNICEAHEYRSIRRKILSNFVYSIRPDSAEMN